MITVTLLTCRSVEPWRHVSWEWCRQTSWVDRCRVHITHCRVLAQHRVWHWSKPTSYHIQVYFTIQAGNNLQQGFLSMHSTQNASFCLTGLIFRSYYWLNKKKLW